MNNKKLKVSVAFLLCIILTANILPLNITFANLQSHVRDLTLQSVSTGNQTGYSINFSWINPSWSDRADGNYTNKDAPEGFKLQGLNATAKESNFKDLQDQKSANLTNININENLNSGSLYEFRVTPYHYHKDESDKSIIANYDEFTEQETVLFMTDIQVEASGSGNTLNVTFDNPQYKGKDIFDGYRIYYQKGGSQVTNFNNFKDISLKDELIVINSDPNRVGVQRITYPITDASITQGDVYSVKVEPLYNGSELRNTGNLTYKTILVNDTYKKISFKSKSDKEYRTDNANVSIPLEVKEDGKDFLKLNWWGLTNNSGSIDRIEIYSGDNIQSINTKVGTIYSSEAIYVNTWRIEKPIKKTYYKILVYTSGIEVPIESVVAMYDPSTVNVTPNKPNLYANYEIKNNENVLNVYWDVFLRYPYNDTEEVFKEDDGTYIDTNVNYDVWISDSTANVNNVNLPKVLDNKPASELTKQNIQETVNPVYHYEFNEYNTITDQGDFITKKIEENKTYYIKIVARKHLEEELSLSSEESIIQIYVPAKGNISTPQNLSKPPLKIKKDENGKDSITQTKIEIEWKTKWFEIYDQETDDWYTEVAIRNGQLVFGENIQNTDTIVNFYDKNTEEEVKNQFILSGLTQEFVNSITVRTIDLTSSDIKYELQVIDFDTIDNKGGYKEYISNILSNTEDTSNWNIISPTYSDPNNASYIINNLNENTLYAILLRPYRVVSSDKKEAYPTYIIATTLPNETVVEITPITPNLTEKDRSDTSITVKWENYSDSLGYELAINETPLSDPSQSNIFIDSSEIIADGVFETTEQNGSYVSYKIDSLFPNTGYYIWVRAFDLNNSNNISDWSTTLYVKTNELSKPEAPTGLSLASEVHLNIFNSNNNTNYVNLSEDYAIIEFTRNPEDTLTEVTSVSNEDAEMLLTNSNIHSYMVRFKNLTANKDYFFRAKTKVTVAKKGSEPATKYYSYIIEASLDEDFKDSIIIEIPSLQITADKVLTIESDWSTVVKFKTSYSQNNPEYDGNINNQMFPLPTEDFEIIYETATKTLVYRLRSNQKDSEGKNDNLVDQRFISKLLANKTYNYTLDLTSHNGYDISNRRLELPYTIFTALEERKISISLKVGNTTFTLNPGFLNISEIKSTKGLGSDSVIKISIEQQSLETPILDYGKTYSTTPQKIKISVLNGLGEKDIKYVGTNMDISLKLKNRYLIEDANVGAYVQTSDTAYWQKLNGSYESETGTFKVKSKILGNYATVSTQTPDVTSNGSSLYAVNTKIYIKDINNLDLTKPISVVQLNNLMSAVANNRSEATINTALSTNDYNSLKRAGLLLEGSVVSREQGVNSLVKLYENKTKRKYQNYTDINTTSFKDIKNANTAYQKNLLKASELLFFGKSTEARPKDNMTIEEALHMINIILQDSGI